MVTRRPPRESLDYDTWLQQRVALTDDEPDCGCPCGCPDCCPHGIGANVPDEADTDPDYD